MNPAPITRVVRRVALPLLIVSGFLLWWNYGLLRVPAGMDTMLDTHPPGTLCLIQKTPPPPPVGAVVFVAMPDGGQLLVRVVAYREDGALQVACDHRESAFVGVQAEWFAPAAVRGLVLTQFVP